MHTLLSLAAVGILAAALGAVEPPVVPARGPQAVPVIEQVAPEKTSRTTVPQLITLGGLRFSPALTVTMTDPTGVVTVLKGTSLEAVTPTRVRFSATLDVSGDYTFTVTNPPGQTSDTVTIVVS